MLEVEDLKIDGYERVLHGVDETTGLDSHIALHSTKLGPAIGGCRIWPYGKDADPLGDVLLLAKAMTYKTALAGLDFGGGKAVIDLTGSSKTDDMLKSFGELVESLDGSYIVAEDVGSTPEDLEIIGEVTQHVVKGAEGGDASWMTAYGVLMCIEEAVGYHSGNTQGFDGLKVLLEGMGKVGSQLVKLLVESGAEVVVREINPDTCRNATYQLGIEAAPDAQLYAPDVYVPCALGQTVSETNLRTMDPLIICGSANNQLAHDDMGKWLKDRGILYCVDYLVNAGGVINVIGELAKSYDRRTVLNHVKKLPARLMEVIELAKEEDIPTNVAADRLAEKRLAGEES